MPRVKLIRRMRWLTLSVERRNARIHRCDHDWQPVSPTSLVLYCTKCRGSNHP